MRAKWKYLLDLIFGAILFFMVSGNYFVVQAEDSLREANGEPYRIKVHPVSPNKRAIIRRSPGVKIKASGAKLVEPANRVEARQFEAVVSGPIPLEADAIRTAPSRVTVEPLPLKLTPDEIYDYVYVLKHGETMADKAYAAKVLGSLAVRSYLHTDAPLINDVYNALVTAFRENSDEKLLTNIAWAFGGLGKYQAGGVLVNYLAYNTDNKVKPVVILSLGRLQYRESVNNLIQILLYNSDSELKARAAEALGMIGDNSAEYALIQALNEQDHFVKKSAIEALGKIGSSKAKYPLLNILNRENDPELQEEADRALQSLEANGAQ